MASISSESLGSGARELGVAQQKELQQNLLSDVQLAEKLFQDDRLGEAVFLLQNIEEFIKHLGEEAHERVVQKMDDSEIIQKLRVKGKEMLELLELCATNEEWNAWNTGIGPHHDVTVYTHREERKGQYYIKLEGNLHCSMTEACAAIIEQDLYPIWAPMCKGAHCLGSLSPCRRIIALDLEFVLMKRRAAVDVHLDVLPDCDVLFTITPLEDTPANAQHLPDAKSRATLSGGILLRESEVEVEELIQVPDESCSLNRRKGTLHGGKSHHSMMDLYGKDDKRRSAAPRSFLGTRKESRMEVDAAPGMRTKLIKVKKKVISCSVILHADLRLDFIPDWIFNLAVRSSIAMFLPMTEHQAKLFAAGGVFHDRVHNNESYEAIQTKLEEFQNRPNA